MPAQSAAGVPPWAQRLAGISSGGDVAPRVQQVAGTGGDWLYAAATSGGWEIEEVGDASTLIAAVRRDNEERRLVRSRHRRRPRVEDEEEDDDDQDEDEDLDSKLNAYDLWITTLSGERHHDTLAIAPVLLDLLHNEASTNSKVLLAKLAARIGAGEDLVTCFAPLFTDDAVGRWLCDPTNSASFVRVLFKLPEDGDDEALWVTGALREPGHTRRGAPLPNKYPSWNVGEWDIRDLKQAIALTSHRPCDTPPRLAIHRA
ncbi:hypothetical protein CTAYLR_009119 [Chrysophaeum taylorii]|uniref:Uncharacterized protein n=1 Tax=Chrysophaeum taylorii TaxID=2483200 RepID=A0AAD7ULF6_9STRA|nr:hypothetical protein CTAYLR_009119 [Chrysophaeum taylorii]